MANKITTPLEVELVFMGYFKVQAVLDMLHNAIDRRNLYRWLEKKDADGEPELDVEKGRDGNWLFPLATINRMRTEYTLPMLDFEGATRIWAMRYFGISALLGEADAQV